MVNPPLSLTSLCEDVILIICDFLSQTHTESSTPLKHLSLVNPHFRTILSPLLFKTIHINKPISQLPPLPRAAYHARTFKIDMFGSLWWWCSGSYTSHSDALDIFTCISRLENLTTLEVSMMKRSIDIFTSAFSSLQCPSLFLLSRVEKLIVTSSGAFLPAHCPALKYLMIRDDTDECSLEPYTPLPMRLAPLHPHLTLPGCLTHFDATAMWTVPELLALTEYFPNLTSLRMRTDTYCYHMSFAHIISILSQNFKDLNTLHLVKSGYLGMGYQALLWKRRIQACGDDEYRRLMWRKNEALRVQVENEVVRCAFGAIGGLRECWVGEKRVARKYGGKGEMKWMWQRRCEEGEDWGVGIVALEKFRREKEDVVVGCEMGW
jgi:hypothetical protein